jgi:RNA polymerase sigma factor (sigma-70 family)
VNTNTGNHLTDKHLADKVLSGDTGAFGTIIKNTERLVAQIVFKMIANPEDRKDIAQDIYLKAFNKLPGFKFQSKLSTWIARISYNTCMDHLRKKKLILPGNLYEGSEHGNDVMDVIINRSPTAQGIETVAFTPEKELSVILKTEIEKLSPVYKTLIILYHNEELSYEEIAQITEMPEGTVKSYLFRARKALKDSLLLTYKKEDLC